MFVDWFALQFSVVDIASNFKHLEFDEEFHFTQMIVFAFCRNIEILSLHL